MVSDIIVDGVDWADTAVYCLSRQALCTHGNSLAQSTAKVRKIVLSACSCYLKQTACLTVCQFVSTFLFDSNLKKIKWLLYLRQML